MNNYIYIYIYIYETFIIDPLVILIFSNAAVVQCFGFPGCFVGFHRLKILMLPFLGANRSANLPLFKNIIHPLLVS